MPKVKKSKFLFDMGSDLHVDFVGGARCFKWAEMKAEARTSYIKRTDYADENPPEVDTIVIAGDASNSLEETAEVMRELKKVYKNVLYVDGNHDHYNSRRSGMTVESDLSLLQDHADADDWTFLAFDDFIIGDTVFIGNNGWYDWNASKTISHETQKKAWNTYIADSRLIKFDTVVKDGHVGFMEPDVLAKECAEELERKVKQYENDNNIKHIVVVTHTMPIDQAIVYREDNVWNALNGTFYNSNMQHVYNNSTKIRYWLFGHTHFHKDIKHNKMRFICNPKGYPNELGCFDWYPKTLSI